MKKLAVSIFFLCLVAALAACQAQSASTALPPTASIAETPIQFPTAEVTPTETLLPPLNSRFGPPLHYMRMFNKSDGWGLVSNQLLLTHDAGTTWYSVPMGAGQVDDLTQAFFLDSKKFFLVVPAPDGESGELYSTTNGGGIWKITPVPFIRGQLIFIEKTGYFLETKSTGTSTFSTTIYSSPDGGAKWNTIYPDPGQSATIPETGIKTGLSFINPLVGWLGMGGIQKEVTIFKTEDGGQTWTPQNLPAPQNIQELESSTQPPVFFAGDPSNGLIPVDFSAPGGGAKNRVFYSTHDGGTTWDPGAPIVDGNTFMFLDSKTGWIWGNRGMYFTNDGAKSWTSLPVAFGRSEYVTNISFIDEKNGWITTTDDKNSVRIYRSEDGGQTWIFVTP